MPYTTRLHWHIVLFRNSCGTPVGFPHELSAIKFLMVRRCICAAAAHCWTKKKEKKYLLFICQITVSHHWIKSAISLIRKKQNQCVHCGGSSLWAHGIFKRKTSDKDIHRSKIYLLLDLFSCFLSQQSRNRFHSQVNTTWVEFFLLFFCVIIPTTD